MLTVAILAISLLLLAQFAVLYLRTLLMAGAAEELSERVEQLGPAVQDVETVICLHRLCGELGAARRDPGLAAARLYHRLMNGLASAASERLPRLAAWARAEMETCSRYALVKLDHRMAENSAFAAAVRSRV